MMEDKDECVSTIGKRRFFWLRKIIMMHTFIVICVSNRHCAMFERDMAKHNMSVC